MPTCMETRFLSNDKDNLSILAPCHFDEIITTKYIYHAGGWAFYDSLILNSKKKQSYVYEALTERSNNYERYRMLTLYLLLSLCVHLRKENL